ncbi:hypothetical protein C1T06_22630 [Vibrio parahaemolyticus]|nr:hypothetical protein C1T06_22630 [Vibrio parahaemolyticus]
MSNDTTMNIDFRAQMRILDDKIKESDKTIETLSDIVISERDDDRPNYTLRYKYLEGIGSNKPIEAMFPLEDLHNEVAHNYSLRDKALKKLSTANRKEIRTCRGWAFIAILFAVINSLVLMMNLSLLRTG